MLDPHSTQIEDARSGRRDLRARLVETVRGWSPSRGDLAYFVGMPIVVPALLFVLLRPDWYTLQNGLDPYFYTGWAQNLGDAMAVTGELHYSVSRWSVYLPSHVFFLLFGPQYGHVFLRWACVAGIVAMILRFGHRRWGRAPAALAAFCVILNPMFVRSIFSDYADVVVLPFGISMILLLLRANRNSLFAVIGGATGGLCIVANLFSASMVAIVGLVSVVAAISWRRRLEIIVGAGLGAALVIGLGFAWFRWRYGIDNVYRPSIEFARDFQGGRDPLRKLRSNWVGYYLWIYAPPLEIAVLVAVSRLRQMMLTRPELAIVGITAVQFLFQVWWQVAKNGTTLEISYYWMYVLPSLTLTSAILIGRCASLVSSRVGVACGCALLVLLVLFQKGPELFPTWIVAAALVGALLVASLYLLRAAPFVMLVFAVFVPFSLAYLYPRPLPLKAGDFGLDAQYSSVFHQTSSPAQRYFLAGSWLVRQIDAFPRHIERNMYYWTGTGESFQMAAMELAHIDDRLINDWTSPDPLAARPGLYDIMAAGEIRYLALVGTDGDLQRFEAELDSRALVHHVIGTAARGGTGGVTLKVLQLDISLAP